MKNSGQANSGSYSKYTYTEVDEAGDVYDTTQESVRYLASAEYFDNWSGRGAWPIVIANRAVKDLRQMRKGDGHVFKMISKKIKWITTQSSLDSFPPVVPVPRELSQGFFSDDNQKRLVGLNSEVPIYEAKVSRDLRIVYQIDLDTDVKLNVDKQIIKLYGIFTHAQMDNRLWAMVSHYHATRRGKEYRRRCLFRDTPRTLGNNVTLPAQFPHSEDVEVPIEPQVDERAGEGDMKSEDLSAVRSMVASDRFMLMSKNLVKSILDDTEQAQIFQVSAKEKEVIYYDSACFVLGRSGTGKTTCIVFKMLGIEKEFEHTEEPKPRQVFITQSPELARRVQEYYHGLVGRDFSRFTQSNQTTTEDEPILIDLRDENVESFGLPSRYSLLEDKYFPLFLTFDQLCSLLEEDYTHTFGRLARSQALTRRFNPEFRATMENESKRDQAYINDQLLPAVLTMDGIKRNKHASVTFEVFAVAYWPHFDQRLTKGLDPALVYSEFLGVIEGSELTLANELGVLSRDEYLGLRYGNSLLLSQRDRIYDLYESYRKLKARLGGYDAAERTHALIVATEDGKRIPGPKIDALYVDEAQDNLLIDTKLIRNLSNNPHGILMAGDTAQTISAGNSFRFEDLKAFSWRLENQDEAVRANMRQMIQPTLFHLSVNYRSHGGIVDCAGAIVGLVSELFPNSIDKLKKESGLIGGPRPTFFSGWESGSIAINKFLRDQGDVKIDFGADQVILVRNDAARSALRAQVGEIGLVLTLYESKGLEFNDVLLYNFFEDSVATATTWRIVLKALDTNKYGPLPQFNEVRHAVVCSELKNLYVGLTRARNNCWILDVSEKAEPMKMFWTELKLIEQCSPGDPVPQLSKSSTNAEWEERGRNLFERQLYPQAMLCFERAGLTLEREISAAYEARKQARLIQATKSNERDSQAAFRNAAQRFLECGKTATSKQQNSCYLRAADCFIQANDWKAAAETFILARDYGMAAKSFRNAACFREAVDIVKVHQEDIQESVVEDIKKVARLEYLRTAQYEQAEELFENLDEQLDYMEDCGLESGRIHVLEQHQRHEEAVEAAAETAFGEGDIVRGIQLLCSSNDPVLVRRAAKKALDGLWILFPFSHESDPTDNPGADTLIQHLYADTGLLGEEEMYQLEIFRVIRARDQSRIGSLARSHGILGSDTPYRSILSLLCFPRSSTTLIPTKEWTIQDFINTAKLTWKYISQLFLFARTLNISDLSTQRLLGIEPAEHNTTESNGGVTTSPGFRIYSTSILFNCFQPAETPSQGIAAFNSVLDVIFSTVSEYDAQALALNALYSSLRSEISKVHEAASSSEFQALYPCLDFAVFGNSPETERQNSFNLRTRALIMQIYISDKYYAQTRPDETERRRIRRTWAHKMYENLMPFFPPLGGIHCVDGAIIPELNKGAELISVWCHQALFELDPRYGAEERFLSDALAFMDLAFRIDGTGFAAYVGALHSSRLVKIRQDLMSSKPRFPSSQSSHSIMHDFVNFYRRKSEDAIWRVIHATRHVVSHGLTIEANLLVHLLEFIGREIIVQNRAKQRGKYGVFDGLVVPHSWALDLAKRPPLVPQRQLGPAELADYLSVLYRALEILRNYIPKTPRELVNSQQSKSNLGSAFYSFSGKGALNLLGRGILILRISRLVVLVANNTNFTPPMKEAARQSISRALTGQGEIHRSLCERIAHNRSWGDLEVSIMRSPLNRGADQLVRLFLRKNNYPQPRSNHFIRAVIYNTVPELNKLLSFTSSVQQPQPTLNPQAGAFNPSQLAQPSSTNQAAAPTQEKEPEAGEPEVDTGDVTLSDHEPSHFIAMPEDPSESMRTLTVDEIQAGSKILLVYRRYVRQKQNRQLLALETIWRCYSRYIRRRNAPRSPVDERYHKFQLEYKKDTKALEYSRSSPASFYRHKAILFGCMPHVAASLRCLEHVNRSQKHANRKRLQTADHKDLEEIQARMDACGKFTIGLKKLASAIMPGSKDLQNLRALQAHVKDLENVYREIEEEFGRGTIPASLEQHRWWGIAPILARPI